VITAVEGTTFKVSGISGLEEGSGTDVDLTFDVLVTDGDNDTVTTSFDVTFDADGDLTGTAGDDVIVNGNAGSTLYGLGGNDILSGLDGDDILIGGAGSDTLTGGDGTDTFVYSVGDGGATLGLADLITDFVEGTDIIGLDGLAFGTGDGEASFVTADNVGGSISDTALVINQGVGGYSEVLAVIEGVTGLDVTDTAVM